MVHKESNEQLFVKLFNVAKTLTYHCVVAVRFWGLATECSDPEAPDLGWARADSVEIMILF